MRRSKRAAVAVVALGLAGTAAATEIPWEPHLSSSRPDGPTAVVAGDFDGDGDLDAMVASDGDDRVRWAVNTDGAGAFGFLQTVAVVANPVDLAVGDLDGDGDLDAVAASFGAPGALVWLENDGSPDALAWPAREIAERVTPIDVELADLDGDGDLDVAAASVLDDGIAWHENDGAAVPSFTLRGVTFDEDGLGGAEGDADGAAAVLALDLDSDGDLDLVTASHDNDRVAWHENTDGAGGFGAQQAIDSTLDGARRLAAGDFDRDGDPDLVASGLIDGRVVRFLQTAPGVFASPQLVDERAGASTLDVADPDRDGDLDLLMADDHGVRWREHAGDLGVRTLDVSVAPDWGPHAAAWADLDGDGDLDVLAARHAVDHPIWFENETIHRSAVLPEAPLDLAALDDLDVVAAGDLDGDGDADLVSTSWLREPNDPQGFFLLWSENTGAGFAPQERLAGITAPGSDIELGDVDADGDLDVLLSMEGTTQSVLEWWENEGGATLVLGQRLGGGRLWPDVELADLDRDGDLDVVAADW
ncbi:MAG TPA: VCBS repeat-containing protein, partial [Thermoanaerobaculia bacterium]|nr:VCBS repeat-containing protein [Thermoanaerobaculia bacterium]